MGERRDERQGGERAGKGQSDEVQVRVRTGSGEMTDQPDRTTAGVLTMDDEMFLRFDREHRYDACDCQRHDSVQALVYFRAALRLERERVAAICDKLEVALTLDEVYEVYRDNVLALVKEIRK